MDKAETSPFSKPAYQEKKGIREGSEAVLSIDKFEIGTISKKDTKNNRERDSLDLPESTQRFNNSN